MTPYKVAIASHKGGTGRTTTALVLAWHLGQQGHQVTLVDTDPLRAATRVSHGPDGECCWPGVTVVQGIPDWDSLSGEFTIVDGPPLLGSTRNEVLPFVDAVILTCLPEALAIRTLPAATTALRQELSDQNQLNLLGVLLTGVDETDPLHCWVLQEFQDLHPTLLHEPPVPFQIEIAEWPFMPGGAPPQGPARESYAVLASGIRRQVPQTTPQGIFG